MPKAFQQEAFKLAHAMGVGDRISNPDYALLYPKSASVQRGIVNQAKALKHGSGIEAKPPTEGRNRSADMPAVENAEEVAAEPAVEHDVSPLAPSRADRPDRTADVSKSEQAADPVDEDHLYDLYKTRKDHDGR